MLCARLCNRINDELPRSLASCNTNHRAEIKFCKSNQPNTATSTEIMEINEDLKARNKLLSTSHIPHEWWMDSSWNGSATHDGFCNAGFRYFVFIPTEEVESLPFGTAVGAFKLQLSYGPKLTTVRSCTFVTWIYCERTWKFKRWIAPKGR